MYCFRDNTEGYTLLVLFCFLCR